MKHSESKYPVGARWEATNDRKMIGCIFLEQRHENFEIWHWYVTYSDGSFSNGDWNRSYSSCRDEIPLWNHNGTKIRFKRIK